MRQIIETQSLVESLISENVMLREQRDEAEKALHRLPTPPKEMGDGPDERAINVLQLWQSALLWAALWKRRAKLTKSQRDFVSAHFGTLSDRLMETEAELEREREQLLDHIASLVQEGQKVEAERDAALTKLAEYEGDDKRWHSFETVQAIVKERDAALIEAATEKQRAGIDGMSARIRDHARQKGRTNSLERARAALDGAK